MVIEVNAGRIEMVIEVHAERIGMVIDRGTGYADRDVYRQRYRLSG